LETTLASESWEKGMFRVLMKKKKENIGNVFYVLELKSNLISIDQLQEREVVIFMTLRKN